MSQLAWSTDPAFPLYLWGPSCISLFSLATSFGSQLEAKLPGEPRSYSAWWMCSHCQSLSGGMRRDLTCILTWRDRFHSKIQGRNKQRPLGGGGVFYLQCGWSNLPGLWLKIRASFASQTNRRGDPLPCLTAVFFFWAKSLLPLETVWHRIKLCNCPVKVYPGAPLLSS